MRVACRALAVVVFAIGCGPAAPEPRASTPREAVQMLPDVRLAKDRPPVALVVRDGDPAAAIAMAVRTSEDDDAEPATALAGVIESRLVARGLAPIVTPAWDGLRASLLVANVGDARAAIDAIQAALAAPIRDEDLGGAKKKLAALGARPLGDAALSRWARCVGAPYAMPDRAAKAADELAVARLEAWRAASQVLGRAAIAVTGPRPIGEAVATAVAQGPAWRTSAPAATTAPRTGGIDVEVYESSSLPTTTVHATLDVGTSSAAVASAEALGDPRGPLAMRLAALEVPFKLREVAGTAHARGGCVGVVLEAWSDRSASDLAPLVADAIALVHVEAQVRLADGGAVDGRTLARRAGDAREAAERAAWWALVDAPSPASGPAPGGMRGSVALGLPTRRGSSGGATRDALAAAMEHAMDAWRRPAIEGRTRVENGQGEAWILFASPCGTDGESDADAGITALVTMAAAEAARSSPDARVEPWIVPDGAGLVVHGPALAGESPAAHARRLADIVARAFAGDPIAPAPLARARAALLELDVRSDGAALGALAMALSPGRPSSVVATGREDALARSADAVVAARAQALRGGPLRIAVVANTDASQGDAALRAADRWVDRRGGGACKGAATSAVAPRPGTYAIEPRAGAMPEAYLAFPFAPADEASHAAALVVAAGLDGDAGMLAKALGAGLARSWSARVIGWPRAPALVVRVVAPQASLDGAVMQARALVDRLHKGGLLGPELERATALAARAALSSSLDPRARVVATWRGEAFPPAPPAGGDAVRAFADKYLGEDALVVVAARPGRVRGTSP